MAHWECRYCDRPAGIARIVAGDEVICMCGAEWEDAKIFVEDEYLVEDIDESEDIDEDDEWDDRLSCGCCSCCGCSCDYDDYDELEAMERKAHEEW